MKIFAAFLLLSICCFAQDKDREQASATLTCSQTSFFGDVKLGLPFSQTIGDGLTFRLLPTVQKSSSTTAAPKFTGWTIQVVYLGKRGEMEREFSEIVTPPYRESGPREIDVSSGSEAQAKKDDHTINFVTTTLDFAEANKVIRPIMWRSSPQEVREAAEELPHIPIGTARLTILRQQQAISFKVDLYVPTSVTLAPELAGKSKTVQCPTPKLSELFHEMQQ